ncbi:MAG TPA: cardiolipin synthase [Methylomirabilota bacterium]|nr:cardiolipin synthase [Methylomirabilota bacterium]
MRRSRLRHGAALTLIMALAVSCASFKPRVQLPEMTVGQSGFAATVAAYTGTPLVAGNRVQILLNGDEIFPATLAAIRSAKKTINYLQYVFEDGPPAEQIARALAERCRAGVKVNVLLDAVGSLLMAPEHREVMTSAGCRVESYRPLTSFAIHRVNYRNHRRILVVDGRLGVTGGSGVSEKWGGSGRQEGYWRDTDVKVEGPIVEQLQAAFVDNWLETTGIALGGESYFPGARPAKDGVDALVVRSSPRQGATAMYSMFLLSMAAARRSIYITNPYFVPDKEMIDTLVAARGKGVRVIVLLPGQIDHNIVRQASRAELGRLLKAGIEVYEYQAALLHAKTMVVDGVWATIGSANLDRRSLALNQELNLVAYDRTIGRRLEEVFEQDLRHSKRLTYEAWHQRGLYGRFLEFLSIPVREQL